MESARNMNRRDFVRRSTLGGLVLGFGMHTVAQEQTSSGVPRRAFGRTGEKISAIGLGGYHIGNPREEEQSIRMIRSAIDQGITFMDNCWDYHDGDSEVRMGKALRDGYREKVFLMSKIDGQTRSAAARQIEESLRRLQTDRVDLMQFHEIIRKEDPDRLFAKGGGMEAMLEAQKAGKVRYIGFTGHKDPSLHLRMLDACEKQGVRMDAVQMPLNLLDAQYRSFAKEVLPRLVRDGIAALGMKPLSSGHLLKTKAVTPEECLHYAMTLPTSVVITGMDKPEYIDQALQAARTFKPLSDTQVAALLEKTAQFAKEGKNEPFKTTTQYDGTVQNPQWLGLGG